MALYKRGQTWHTDFSVNGQRYRQSLDTSDWREAQSKEKDLIAQASTGKLVPANQQFARLAFSDAADRYLEARKLDLSDRRLEKERQLLVKPRDFFGALQLSRMSGEDLQSYREHRSQTGAGPAYINMEVGTICRILKRAKRWHVVAADLRPLKERRRVGRALSPGEKQWLLRVADSRPEWQIARYAAILALNTTMRGCELKGLRWCDVSLIDGTLNIQRSKTEAGERIIPLNNDAMAAVLGLYKRAQGLEATDMNHFVFPACENGKIDPKRPQETWRTAWRKLTRAVQCHACGELQSPSTTCANDACGADIHELKSPLAELRFHDLLHHAITELAESQASEQTIMSIAGHVSSKMLAHYSHVRLDAKRRALEALSGGGGGGYVTNHVTNQVRKVGTNPEVTEKYGRPVRARTADLHRVKVAL